MESPFPPLTRIGAIFRGKIALRPKVIAVPAAILVVTTGAPDAAERKAVIALVPVRRKWVWFEVQAELSKQLCAASRWTGAKG